MLATKKISIFHLKKNTMVNFHIDQLSPKFHLHKEEKQHEQADGDTQHELAGVVGVRGGGWHGDVLGVHGASLALNVLEDL